MLNEINLKTLSFCPQKMDETALLIDDLSDQQPVVSSNADVIQSTYASDLPLLDLRCSDSTDYTCTAKNSLGSGVTSGEIKLDVRCESQKNDSICCRHGYCPLYRNGHLS
jgi:hypothetical protein